MTIEELRSMKESQIVEMLINLKPSDQAAAWLASVVCDESAFEGVCELRRRFASPASHSTGRSKRMRSAHSVRIDRERWNAFFWRRRIALSDIGGLMEPPRSDGFGSVVGYKGSTSFHALDDLACALGMHVDDLIEQVGTDEEIERMSA